MGIDLQDATPLYQQIVNDIKSQISAGSLVVGDKMPSQNELARVYDVSLITVKRALAELINEGVLFSRVGKGTYVARKPPAGGLTEHVTIGLVLRDLQSPYFSRIVRSVEGEVSERGFNLLVSTSANQVEKEEGQIYHYRKMGVHGLIIASMTRQYRASGALRELHAENFPYVVVSYIADEDINYVGTDHEYGAYLATEHLIKMGYRSIGYINGEPGNLLGELRKKGFLSALTQYGVPFHQNFEFHLRLRGEWNDYTSGYEIGQTFAGLEKRPRAMFIYNDLSALGFQKAVLDKGLRVPGDVAMVGFDNINQSVTAPVPLTTIHQPTEKIGPLAVDLLTKLIQSQPAERRIVLKPALVIRESCGSGMPVKDGFAKN